MAFLILGAAMARTEDFQIPDLFPSPRRIVACKEIQMTSSTGDPRASSTGTTPTKHDAAEGRLSQELERVFLLILYRSQSSREGGSRGEACGIPQYCWVETGMLL